MKVSVKPFQRLAESKGGALVADRSQRNALIHQNRRKGEKIFRRMIFSWETHGMGFPKAITNLKTARKNPCPARCIFLLSVGQAFMLAVKALTACLLQNGTEKSVPHMAEIYQFQQRSPANAL
ncbi:MAG: hypothetical protein MJ173_05560 [Clostridia bacterium]|nr:hypothetical protein [Clostridia bacterium]